MKALLVDNSGGKPEMIMGDFPDPEPAARELLVKIKATALNRADLMQKNGKYPPPEGASPVLGLEMAGIVEQTGDEVTRFKSGDRVFGLLAGGGYAEKCVIREDLAMKIPPSYTFGEAAAIPEVFLTAWQALSWLGNIKRRDTVLIHAGASGVGSAAIQLAHVHFGSRVVITAGSREKLDACKELGADVAINYKNEDFAEVVSGKLGQNSVDLIIDFIGAPYWEKNLRILAVDGRLVYLSMLGGAGIDNANLIPVLRKRLTIRGSTLRNRSDDYKVRLTADFTTHAMELLSGKRLRPVIDSVFDWSDVEKAHQLMENNKNTGKIILSGM